jgi:hypothetical protein
MALAEGGSVRWVADVLGRADPALTLRVCAHAMRSEESDLSVSRVARLMYDRRIHRVLVVEGGELQGLISSLDLVGVLASAES